MLADQDPKATAKPYRCLIPRWTPADIPQLLPLCPRRPPEASIRQDSLPAPSPAGASYRRDPLPPPGDDPGRASAGPDSPYPAVRWAGCGHGICSVGEVQHGWVHWRRLDDFYLSISLSLPGALGVAPAPGPLSNPVTGCRALRYMHDAHLLLLTSRQTPSSQL